MKLNIQVVSFLVSIVAVLISGWVLVQVVHVNEQTRAEAFNTEGLPDSVWVKMEETPEVVKWARHFHANDGSSVRVDVEQLVGEQASIEVWGLCPFGSANNLWTAMRLSEDDWFYFGCNGESVADNLDSLIVNWLGEIPSELKVLI